MIDECPLTFPEVFEHVPPVMPERAIDQTMAVLGWVPAEVTGVPLETPEDAIRIFDALDRDERVAEVAELLIEFVRFVHAARVMAGRFERLRETVDSDFREERGDHARRAAA